MLWLVGIGMAVGQGVPNGDFDGGLSNWEGDGSHRIGVTNASPGYAHVRASDARGLLESSPFVVTSDMMNWDARGDPYTIVVANEDGATTASETDKAVFGQWWGRFLPIDDLCGQLATVNIELLTAGTGVDVDAFALAGDPCPDFEDVDGDGACPRGSDLDGDGLCASEGEVSDEMVDCDDLDAAVGPRAVEQPASGRDEDCDGFEACYLDEDDDDIGTDEIVLSEQWDCLGEGIAPVDGDRCEGFDDRLDADEDGIPDGCDGSEPAMPPAGQPVAPAAGRFRGGACAHGGNGWLFLGAPVAMVLLALMGRRRHRGNVP